jgi:hypothetical protein
VAQPKDRPEYRSVKRGKPREPWLETDSIGDAATVRLRLNDPLVLPDSLGEQRGTLPEAPARLYLCKAHIVVVDGKQAQEE